MLLRSIKQVLAILAVSMFAVAGAPAQRGVVGRAGRVNSVTKGTPVIAGIVLQKEGEDPCWDWDFENSRCLDGDGGSGGGTGGTQWTCTGVTCENGCTFYKQRADKCEYHGKHQNGSCIGNGDSRYWHEHAARLVF